MAKLQCARIDGPEAFRRAFPVSRETISRLVTYEALLKRWQKTINLVAPSTINDIWHRHFADSAQLWTYAGVGRNPRPHLAEGEPSARRGEGLGAGGRAETGLSSSPHPMPEACFQHEPLPAGGRGAYMPSAAQPQHWLDLGSGAGFPGLVIAIMAAEHGGTRHTLVESDNRKAAFLREAAREAGVPVDILCTRIETCEIHAKVREVDCVTARALAPIPRLAQLAAPYCASGTVGFFLKGRDVAAELEETARTWDFQFELKPSVTDPEGRVLLLKALKVKTEG